MSSVPRPILSGEGRDEDVTLDNEGHEIDCSPENSPRILRIVTRLNVGGPSRHVRILRERLETEFGCVQRLVAGRVEGDETQASFAADIADDVVEDLVRPVSWVRDRRALQKLQEIIAEFRPDVVHTHQGKAGWLGRVAACREGVARIVHTYHGHTFDGYWGPIRGRLQRILERRWARRSTDVVVQSASQRDDVLRYLGGDLGDRVRVIPPGIDFRALDADVADDADRIVNRDGGGGEASLGASRFRDGNDAVVAFVGRLAPIKNITGFLHVVKAMVTTMKRTAGDGGVEARRVKALIAGEGEDEALGRRIAGELGLGDNVRWLGTRGDVANVYHAADVVVMTSRSEGTPLSLIEATACGTPVAAFDVGGIRDILGDLATTRLVPFRDTDGLARAAFDLVNLSSTVKEASRRIVRERFDADRLVRDIADLYRHPIHRTIH